MRPARAHEGSDQRLVPARTARYLVHVVTYVPVAVEEPADQIEQEFLRHADRTKGQALPRAEPDLSQPVVKRDVAYLGAEVGPRRVKSYDCGDLVRAADAAEEGRDLFPIATREIDGAVSDETTVGCDQPDSVGELGSPNDCPSGSLSPRSHVVCAAMLSQAAGDILRDPRIRRGRHPKSPVWFATFGRRHARDPRVRCCREPACPPGLV